MPWSSGDRNMGLVGGALALLGHVLERLAFAEASQLALPRELPSGRLGSVAHHLCGSADAILVGRVPRVPPIAAVGQAAVPQDDTAALGRDVLEVGLDQRRLLLIQAPEVSLCHLDLQLVVPTCGTTQAIWRHIQADDALAFAREKGTQCSSRRASASLMPVAPWRCLPSLPNPRAASGRSPRKRRRRLWVPWSAGG